MTADDGSRSPNFLWDAARNTIKQESARQRISPVRMYHRIFRYAERRGLTNEDDVQDKLGERGELASHPYEANLRSSATLLEAAVFESHPELRKDDMQRLHPDTSE